MQEKETEKKVETFFTWDEELGDPMEKINGGCTTICARCDGTGMHDGVPCTCCGGTGWRR